LAVPETAGDEGVHPRFESGKGEAPLVVGDRLPAEPLDLHGGAGDGLVALRVDHHAVQDERSPSRRFLSGERCPGESEENHQEPSAHEIRTPPFRVMKWASLHTFHGYVTSTVDECRRASRIS